MKKTLLNKTLVFTMYIFFMLLDFKARADSNPPPPGPGNNNGGGDLESPDLPLGSTFYIVFLAMAGLFFAYHHFQNLKTKKL